jgi:hypothetical protein
MAVEDHPQGKSTVTPNDLSDIKSALNKLMRLLANDIARRLKQEKSSSGKGPAAKSIDGSHDLSGAGHSA